jgi:hypothetical protein
VSAGPDLPQAAAKLFMANFVKYCPILAKKKFKSLEFDLQPDGHDCR